MCRAVRSLERTSIFDEREQERLLLTLCVEQNIQLNACETTFINHCTHSPTRRRDSTNIPQTPKHKQFRQLPRLFFPLGVDHSKPTRSLNETPSQPFNHQFPKFHLPEALRLLPLSLGLLRLSVSSAILKFVRSVRLCFDPMAASRCFCISRPPPSTRPGFFRLRALLSAPYAAEHGKVTEAATEADVDVDTFRRWWFMLSPDARLILSHILDAGSNVLSASPSSSRTVRWFSSQTC